MPFGLGSSSELGIGIAISLQDRFSSKAVEINKRLMEMRKNSQAALTTAIRDYRNQSLMIAAGAAAISQSLLGMSKAGAEFQHAINQVYIVGGRDLGRTRTQLRDFAQDLSKQFSRSPLEIASGLFENTKQGITQGLEDITKYQVAVATATDEIISGPNGVAANLLNIMNAMDIPKERFKDVANAVTAVANATQSSVYDLGEAMQYGAFTAKQFNLPMTTTLALFGKLSQVGIRGSAAGTALNNMLTQMAKGLGPFRTKAQLKAWEMMGLDPGQITSMMNHGDITGIISAVSKATSGMTIAQKGSILPKAFNMRGTRGMLGLFDSSQGNKSISDILEDAQEGVKNDIAMKQSSAMMNDLHSDFKFFVNAFDRFRNVFSETAAPVLRILLGVGSKALDILSAVIDNPIGKLFTGLLVIVAPVTAALFTFRAALLTATLGLRAMNANSYLMRGSGGFSGLLQAGLGMAGMARFGGKLGAKGIAINAAGRYYIPAGNPSGLINPSTGKLYRPGSPLSKASLEELGMLGARSTGLLSGLLGIAGKILPILGGISLAVEVLKSLGIFDMESKKKENQSSDGVAQYYRLLDRQYWGLSKNNQYYLNGGKNLDPATARKNFNQSIIVNIDGRLASEKTINSTLEQNALTTLNLLNR